ncbi:hypothetical protein [Streptomyces sp. NPDC127190]|uniref:hypothetical protein n=1 Tax=unclassified Streptomyces TaxID=2593676 RepID=UPI00362CAAE6
MSIRRVLTTTATLALGSLALIACDPNSAAGAAPTAAKTGGTHTTAPTAAATVAATVAAKTPAAAPRTHGGTTSHTAPSGSGKSTGTGAGTGTGTGASTHPALCRAGQLTLTAAPVAQPLNHLLITAKNTSGVPCDLGIIGQVSFDGRVRATPPGGLGGGPNILRPGVSNYEGVALDQQDAPGKGSAVSSLTVKLDSGDTVRIPVKAYVHAPHISVWQPNAADALSAA